MSNKSAIRFIKCLLFILGLYKLYYAIALAAIIGCVCSPFGSEWFYVFLVAVVQFGLIGRGCQFASHQYEFLKEAIKDE